MSTLPARHARRLSPSPRRGTVLLLSLAPPAWSEQRAIGRLSQVCERWIYTCVCFALDFDEQKRSGFYYQYSNYQIEYSRNLIFEVGGHMEQVFQALIDRSRAPLDLKTIKTILGSKHRPKCRRRTKRSSEWEV